MSRRQAVSTGPRRRPAALPGKAKERRSAAVVGRTARPPRRRLAQFLALSAALLAVGGVFLMLDALQLVGNVRHAVRPAAVTLLDRTGRPLVTLGDGWPNPLSLDEVSPVLVDAVVAIEDRRFFSHAGIDPQGLVRATVRNISAGRITEGGSTITQQLAKLAFLTPERNFLRKLREATLAIWLDATLSKDAILAAYLDRIYLGSGVTGVRAAARRYFGVEAGSLNLAQSALLAGLIRAPSRLDPSRHREDARQRAAVVLQAMLDTGRISQDQADAARLRPAGVLEPGYLDPGLQTLAERARSLASGSALTVETTLDADLGRRARQILADELAREPRRAGAAALIALAPDGSVLTAASVPGTLTSLDRVTEARRQPGSAFKPILFAAAIESGHRPDEPISTTAPVVDGWRPRNIVEPESTTVTLEAALSRSINTAAVRLGMEVGLAKIIATARRLGIASDLPAVPSLLLGSAEVGMVELTGAYAALAGDGRARPPVWITAITTETGARTALTPPQTIPALTPATAKTMRAMLSDAMVNGTGKAAAIPGGFGKTGTTSGFRDAWFVGGNANGVVVAVWVGNDDRSPMDGETGGSLPARIFRRFMIDGLE